MTKHSWPSVRAVAPLFSGALTLAFALVFTGSAEAAPPKKPRVNLDEPPPSIADCAVVRAEARMEAYGYSHVVVLENRCNVPVTCDVWTDVDPSPRMTLSAAPGERAEVLTRRGSPSRDVSAAKECRRS